MRHKFIEVRFTDHIEVNLTSINEPEACWCHLLARVNIGADDYIRLPLTLGHTVVAIWLLCCWFGVVTA